ncbi:MAG: hypothetical protein SV583_02215 [Pseudomonadota bacterium]|nr:hypothetical protein [Pseudomonadota bacterium]
MKIQATHSATLPVPSRVDRGAPRPSADTPANEAGSAPATAPGSGYPAPRTGSGVHSLGALLPPTQSQPWPSHRHTSPLAHYEATAALPTTAPDYEVVGIDLYA